MRGGEAGFSKSWPRENVWNPECGESWHGEHMEWNGAFHKETVRSDWQQWAPTVSAFNECHILLTRCNKAAGDYSSLDISSGKMSHLWSVSVVCSEGHSFHFGPTLHCTELPAIKIIHAAYSCPVLPFPLAGTPCSMAFRAGFVPGCLASPHKGAGCRKRWRKWYGWDSDTQVSQTRQTPIPNFKLSYGPQVPSKSRWQYELIVQI